MVLGVGLTRLVGWLETRVAPWGQAADARPGVTGTTDPSRRHDRPRAHHRRGRGPGGRRRRARRRAARVPRDRRRAERRIETDDAPRAATFHPSTLELIDEVGVIDEFIAAGLVCRYFDFWDKTTGTLVARMDHDTLHDDTPFPYVVQTEQHKLVRIVLERLRRMPDVDVRLGWAVDAVAQDADRVTVHARYGSDTEVLTGDWLFGCDGGRSTVRKAIGTEFEGYTWPERFAVLTTLYDFAAAMGCSTRSYFADPDQWVNLFKVAGEDMRGRWRVVFAVPPDQTDDDALGDRYAEKVMSGLHPAADPGRSCTATSTTCTSGSPPPSGPGGCSWRRRGARQQPDRRPRPELRRPRRDGTGAHPR